MTKEHAFLRYSVDMRRGIAMVTVATEMIGTQGIDIEVKNSHVKKLIIFVGSSSTFSPGTVLPGDGEAGFHVDQFRKPQPLPFEADRAGKLRPQRL